MIEHRNNTKKPPHKFGSKRYVQATNKDIQSQYYGVHSSTNNATDMEL
jgi:hypothetical protein